MKKSLYTGDLAKAANLSVQAIRNYEALHILPTTERSAKGYRLYTPQHLQALRVMKSLSAGYGWHSAASIMQLIHAADLPAALAIIDACHAEIHRSRSETHEALRILRSISSVSPIGPDGNMVVQRQAMHVNEAARMFGLRVSALRYWEERGLLQPKRDKTNHYRIYDREQMRRLQFIVLLRKANYGIEAIHHVINQLITGSPEQALSAAENRLQDLTRVSHHCMQATAELWAYVSTMPSFSTRMGPR